MQNPRSVTISSYSQVLAVPCLLHSCLLLKKDKLSIYYTHSYLHSPQPPHPAPPPAAAAHPTPSAVRSETPPVRTTTPTPSPAPAPVSAASNEWKQVFENLRDEFEKFKKVVLEEIRTLTDDLDKEIKHRAALEVDIERLKKSRGFPH